MHHHTSSSIITLTGARVRYSGSRTRARFNDDDDDDDDNNTDDDDDDEDDEDPSDSEERPQLNRGTKPSAEGVSSEKRRCT